MKANEFIKFYTASRYLEMAAKELELITQDDSYFQGKIEAIESIITSLNKYKNQYLTEYK